jgi:N-formylglutamate amidohydrolase
MSDPATHRQKDLGHVAALLLDAARNAPEEGPTVVQTAYGRVTVAVDRDAADVHVHDRGATVHVRLDGD